MLIIKLAKAFKDHKIPYALVGGYAVALHGVTRGTIDIDLVINLDRKHYLAAEGILKGLGLAPKLPVTAQEVFLFRKEFIKKRNLIAWSFSNPERPIEVVDIIITENLKNLNVKRVFYHNQEIFIIGLQDLIKMKKKSKRPQDIEDVLALEEKLK